MAAHPPHTISATSPDTHLALRVTPIDDSEGHEWDRFVDGQTQASTYHRYAWRHVVRSSFKHDTHYLVARDARGICGVLPLVRLKSLPFGDFIVSLPYFNYGGVLANHAAAANALLDAAADLGAELGVSHVELRHRSDEFQRLPSRTDKVSMLLQLPATTGELDKRLPSKLRSQARRPLREGATCVFGRVELLEDFYAVFAENMRDLGTPVYAKSFFGSILRTFPQDTTIAIVHLHGKPVAAAFLLQYRDSVEIPWASSLQRVNQLGVNMYLYWNVLHWAVERGAGLFDFGRSTLDSGTFKFKRQWGAEPLQLHWNYWLPNAGELPRINPDNPKYRFAVAAWQKLPLPLANWLGPHIVRNLP